MRIYHSFCFFFFQAEDGIRDIGVTGVQTCALPIFMRMFDKQIQLRMGQANVWRWVPDILPILTEGDPLGVDDFATHHVPLEQAPQAYADFREKKDRKTTSELQSRQYLVCRLLLEKKKMHILSP